MENCRKAWVEYVNKHTDHIAKISLKLPLWSQFVIEHDFTIGDYEWVHNRAWKKIMIEILSAKLLKLWIEK